MSSNYGQSPAQKGSLKSVKIVNTSSLPNLTKSILQSRFDPKRHSKLEELQKQQSVDY